MRRTDLLVLMVSASAAVLAKPAVAEQAPGVEPVQTIQEVVVTANKRAQNIQEVASSISAQTGASLERNKLEQLSDYAAYIPGFSVASAGTPGDAYITVRGISPLSSGSSVATYIDDTPLGSSGIWARSSEFELDLMPFDLDRLELLRGPQGTLYGADAIGGVLKYVLNTPNLHKFQAELGADVDTIDGAGGLGATVDGRVNIPLKQDELALSISGFDKHAPGYINDLATGQSDVNSFSRYGGRVALYWRPSDQFSLKLNAMYQDIRSRDNGAVSYTSLNQTTEPDGTLYITPSGGRTDKLTEDHPLLEPFSKAVQYYSATANWNPGPVDFVSATSFSRTNLSQTKDASLLYGSAFPLLTGGAVPAGLASFDLSLNLDKFTQEFRVVSPQHQPIEWLFGVFYTYERESNTQAAYGLDLNHNPIPAFQPDLAYLTLPTTYQEIAAFGDVTWRVTDKFDITGGVRFARNNQSFSSTQDGVLVGGASSVTNTSHADVTTWMADARYHFTHDVMGYVRVATGYAPGGPNSPVPGLNIPATVGSETLTNYEIGLKSEFWSHRAKVNIAGYDVEWTDIQLPAEVSGISFTENGGSATARGFEFESAVTPLRGFTLGVNAAYTESYLDSLKPQVSVPYLLHDQLALVPPWTMSGTADYEFSPLPEWTAHVGGGLRWVDAQWAVPRAVGQPSYSQPAYTVLDLNASATRGRWTVLAYVRNLTNVRAVQGSIDAQDIQNNSRQLDYYVLQPLTVGLGFKARFD